MKKGLVLSIIIMILACLALPALAAKASTPGNQSVSHPEEIEEGAGAHWKTPVSMKEKAIRLPAPLLL